MVFNEKYRVGDGGWQTLEIRDSQYIALWRSIRKEMDLLHRKLAFDLGNDGWWALCWVFLQYSLALSKDDWVEEVLISRDGEAEWSHHFAKAFKDLEMAWVGTVSLKDPSL